MRTFAWLMLIVCTFLMACGGETTGDAKSTNKTTEKSAVSKKDKEKSVLHQKYARSSDERKERSKEKMAHYADDVFMNRAVRDSERYCKCKENEDPTLVKSCQERLMEVHEGKKSRFPEAKYKIYDQTYREEIAKCQ